MNGIMKKNDLVPDLFNDSKVEYKSVRNNGLKTTDINILLNRVRIIKKTEYKNKIISLSLLLSLTGFVVFFFLF